MGEMGLGLLETTTLWGGIDVVRIAPATWTATAEARAAQHSPGGYCPTRRVPYGPADLRAELVADACHSTGCFDIFHDLLVGVVAKVRRHIELHPGQSIDNLPAFASSVARCQVSELQRTGRTRRGLPAKPTRNDGAAGRVNCVLARKPEIGEWLVILFRILRAYPFSRHHVCGSWPIDGLVEERAKYLPGGDRSVVRREIDLVMATATAEAGFAWMYDNLTGPLMSEGVPGELADDVADPAPVPFADKAMAGLLHRAYLDLRGRGYSRRAALAEASREVCGIVPVIDAAMEEILDELEAQPLLRPTPPRCPRR